jgi:hypothetical protein
MAIYSEGFQKGLFAVSHTRGLSGKFFTIWTHIFHFGYSVCSKSSIDTLRNPQRIHSWGPLPVIVNEVTPSSLKILPALRRTVYGPKELSRNLSIFYIRGLFRIRGPRAGTFAGAIPTSLCPKYEKYAVIFFVTILLRVYTTYVSCRQLIVNYLYNENKYNVLLNTTVYVE